MKNRIMILLFTFLPLLSFAVGIPEENKELIRSVTTTGIVIVLLSLTIVSIMVALMSKIIEYSRNRTTKEKILTKETIIEVPGDDDAIVAIATALHLEIRSLQEEEKAILTIRKVIKPFSAWNNKTYGMRNI